MRREDSPSWSRMRGELWPGDDAGHAREIERFFSGKLPGPVAILVAEEPGGLVGFVELSIRRFAEGCATDHVGYVEGWYVASEVRRRGVGRALIVAAEEWARGQGCTELASDADLHNSVGDAAHRCCGFDEVAQVRSYRKVL